MTGALPERAVVARESAAAVQRIPLIGELPEQVQLVRPDRDGGRVTAGFRSLRAPEGYDVVEDDGVRLSSVAQTLVDLGRRRPMRSARAGRRWRKSVRWRRADRVHGGTPDCCGR